MLWHFARHRAIENEQTIDILGSEAKAEHASPQRREAKKKRQWNMVWEGGVAYKYEENEEQAAAEH